MAVHTRVSKMGLVIGGVINTPPEPVAKPESPKPTQAVNSLADLRKQVASSEPEQFSKPQTRNVVRSHPRQNYSSDEHLVVVDGKPKKIGKQSKYLLDMLTIDE